MITSIVIDKRSLPSVSVVSSSPGVPSPNKVYSKAVGGPVLRTSQPRQQQQQHLTTITTHVIQTTAANNNGDHQQLTNSSSKPSAQRYKTELCRSYHETGLCKYGDKCQFAHGTNEVRTLNRHPKYKTVLCRTYHCTGYCPYGPRCHFLHDECGDILPPSSIIKPSIGSSISPSSSFGSDMRSSISSSRSISPMDSPTTSNYSDFGTYSDDDGSHSQITILNPADYLFLPSFVFNK